MAKKKSKKKPVRRRRIGSTAGALSPTGPLVTYGSMLLGFVAGPKILDPLLAKVVPATMDQKIVGIAEAGIGAALVYSKGKKSVIKTALGGVLIGAGVKKTMGAFGIGGFQMVPAVSGLSKVRSINGPGPSGYNPGAGLNGYKTAAVAVNGSLMDSSMMR